MNSLAIRIHHEQRLKKKRASYWFGDKKSGRSARMVIDTPKPCSCWMCGNPRKHLGEKTLKERSAEQLANLQAY